MFGSLKLSLIFAKYRKMHPKYWQNSEQILCYFKSLFINHLLSRDQYQWLCKVKKNHRQKLFYRSKVYVIVMDGWTEKIVSASNTNLLGQRPKILFICQQLRVAIFGVAHYMSAEHHLHIQLNTQQLYTCVNIHASTDTN